MPGTGTGRTGELVFNGQRVSVLQDEESPGDWLHDNVNALNVTDPYTLKWLRR